jgi:hypothetical protein
MATEKQKLAIDKIVENRGNVSKAMREAGYSPATAKNPSNLLDSKGFMELMDERGLTDSLIIDALVEDIVSKPGNRTAELQLAVKMRGRQVDKLDMTTNGKDLPTPILGGAAKGVSDNDSDK